MLLPPEQLNAWPEWPESPPFEYASHPNLKKYTFTVMKDTLSNGDVRIAIQRYRKYILGFGEMAAEGFVVDSENNRRFCAEGELYDLT